MVNNHLPNGMILPAPPHVLFLLAIPASQHLRTFGQSNNSAKCRTWWMVVTLLVVVVVVVVAVVVVVHVLVVLVIIVVFFRFCLLCVGLLCLDCFDFVWFLLILFVCLSVCLFVCWLVCLLVCLFVCPCLFLCHQKNAFFGEVALGHGHFPFLVFRNPGLLLEVPNSAFCCFERNAAGIVFVFTGSAKLYLGVSENSGFSHQIIHFNRGFPLFSPSIPFWGTPIFGNTLISPGTNITKTMWIYNELKLF